MSVKRDGAVATSAPEATTLAKTQIPAEHLQVLLQRFESLVTSIVALKEEIAMVPGVDEW